MFSTLDINGQAARARGCLQSDHHAHSRRACGHRKGTPAALECRAEGHPWAPTPADSPGQCLRLWLTSPLWYVLGFAFAGFSFVFVTIGMSWLISHRHKGDRHKGLPYESGIDTMGDTWGRFGRSFYIYALLFVAFDIEVVFITLWALVFRDLMVGGFVSMLLFVSILLLGLVYAWRLGVLTWK